MGLKEDLVVEVARIFREQWATRDGQLVPDPEDLRLGNHAVKLEATVLYADMSDSTTLVDTKKAAFAAEVYKAYLTCAARILKDEGGTITAYDGDRVMAVFVDDARDDAAARAALKLNYAVTAIINPAIKHQYVRSTYQLSHAVGIDRSSIFAARIGVRNDNDIVWVGRAANYAAKLSSLDRPGHVYITEDVFDELTVAARYGGPNSLLMWEERTWRDMTVYRSSWRWVV